ncbi:hypothetical protein VPH35_064980 [Triticum aestivum]
MSTSEGSESADSMDENTSQVPHARRSKFEDPYCRGLPINSGGLQEEVFIDHEKKTIQSLKIPTFSHGLTECNQHFKSRVATQFMMMQ